jgi:nuclear pore complex protein Nup188
VVLGEPASVGTLLEIAGSATDILSQLVSRPAGQALAPSSAFSSTSSESPLDVSVAENTIRRTLESTFFYATTQLGLWLVRPEALEITDTEMDEGADGSITSAGRARLDDRVRRGMVGEMAGELRSAAERARGVLTKSRGKEKDIDVVGVLLHFLNERVIRVAL